MNKLARPTLLLALCLATTAVAAGPVISIVSGPKAAKLEQMAAEEVASQMTSLFGAKVKTTTKLEHTANVVLIGNPKTNPAIAELMGDNWPDLGDQGHLLKSIKTEHGIVLVVGGGSPVSTYWAAAELGHHFGIRRLLHRDFPPLIQPKFSLAEINVQLKPNLEIRAWRTIGAGPDSQESWSLTEHKLRLRQLAKLKFNCIVLSLHAWQPFTHFEHGGIKKRTGVLWHGKTFRVDGETAGRAAFGRDRIFNNPDFKNAKTYQQRHEAGVKLVQGIMTEARSLGMRVVLEINTMEFPIEFAPIFNGIENPADTISFSLKIGGLTKPMREVLGALVETRMESLRDLYPDVGGIAQRLDTPRQLDTFIMAKNGPKMVRYRCKPLEIGNRIGNVLPQFDLDALHKATQQARENNRNGFVAVCRLADDMNTPVFYLSRAGFDKKFTPRKAVDALVTPISGAGVGGRIAIGFDHLAKAGALVDKHGPRIATLHPEVIMQHYTLNEPVPEWWAEAKGGFAMAMNEMYRANTRARGGAREYSLYLAKRFEFALHYFTCLEATRLAGIAKAKNDKEAQAEQLDKAVEAMHNALGAMADVDRNNADRGLIAALNEYGFRPLLRELEKTDP